MGQTRPLFVYFRFMSHIARTNLTINYKSIDGDTGSRTWGGRMEGADESTELRRHQCSYSLSIFRFLAISSVHIFQTANRNYL